MTLPVILASGTMPTDELKQHPWLQLDATLPKPFTTAELLDMVKKILGAADSVANSAQLFRDCAMQDNQISQTEKPANAPIRDQINPSHRILVVDDDNDTRQLSVDVLVNSGYDVEGVKDGAAGWKALQADNNYDLVVSGLQVLKTIKADEHLKMIPVVALTSSRLTSDLIEFYKHGVNAYVVKPVGFSEFVTAIKQLGVFWMAVNEPPPVTWRKENGVQNGNVAFSEKKKFVDEIHAPLATL
jgi:CheY-like chemotaxis protein